MFLKVALQCESGTAHITLEGPFASVRPAVSLQVRLAHKRLFAIRTDVLLRLPTAPARLARSRMPPAVVRQDRVWVYGSHLGNIRVATRRRHHWALEGRQLGEHGQ